MKIKPILNRIIIKQHQKKSTFYIPPETRRGSMMSYQGEVVAVGDQAVTVKEGDKVTWGMHAGFTIGEPKEGLRIMNDDDVLGILEEGYINE